MCGDKGICKFKLVQNIQGKSCLFGILFYKYWLFHMLHKIKLNLYA